MGDGYREKASVQIVAQSDAHIGLLCPILADSSTRQVRHIGKMAVAVVAIKIIWLSVVRDKQIHEAIVVKVFPNGGQSKTTLRIINSRLYRNVRKCAITIIVIEVVTRAFKPPRTALHINWEIVQAKIHVVSHEQVGI